jgi:hypothetical protein
MPNKTSSCGSVLLIAALAMGTIAACAQGAADVSDGRQPAAGPQLSQTQTAGQESVSPQTGAGKAPVETQAQMTGVSTAGQAMKPDGSAEVTGNAASSARIASMAAVIARFKSMGVGVTPYENKLSEARSLLSEGRTAESQAVLTHLDSLLRDQQKSFYANKLQAWRNQQRNLIAARVGVKKHSGNNQATAAPQGASVGFSRAVNGVLTGAKGEYKPLIYPIAR